jgi:hypothetical protein
MSAPTTAKVEAAVEAAKQGKPGAADVLRQHMAYFHNLAVAVAPGSMAKPNPNSDPVRFERWSQLAISCAKALIGYETPRPVAQQPEVTFAPSVSVNVGVSVGADDIDYERLTTEALTKLYRSKIAGEAWVPGPSDYLPVGAKPADLVAPSVRVPEAVPVSNAPVEMEPVELEELEPVVSEPEPEAVRSFTTGLLVVR